MERTSYGYDLFLPESLDVNQTFILRMTYALSDRASKVLFKREILYPTSALYLVLDPSQLKFKDIEGLLSLSTMEEDEELLLYGRGNLPPGFEFSVMVIAPSSSNIWLWLGMGTMTSLIVGSTLLGLRRRGDTGKLMARKKAILRVLRKIDEDYKEGQLSEIAYLRAKLRFLEKLERIERKLTRMQPKEG